MRWPEIRMRMFPLSHNLLYNINYVNLDQFVKIVGHYKPTLLDQVGLSSINQVPTDDLSLDLRLIKLKTKIPPIPRSITLPGSGTTVLICCN